MSDKRYDSKNRWRNKSIAFRGSPEEAAELDKRWRLCGYSSKQDYLSDVKTITKTQYEQVLKTYPVITELYAAIKEFYEILYSRRDERLETWLEKIENFNIPELQTYVNGIRIDINAVKNGIKLKYNNGLAEGSVNKIKVIKRIMYGRNSFDLLKAKVLLHEHFRCEFN